MRRSTTFWAAALLLLSGIALAGVSSAGPLFGRHHGGPGGGGPGGPGPGFGLIEEHADELGIDAATLEKIEAIIEDSRADHHDVRTELRDAHDAMRALLAEEEPDRDAVMRQAEVIGALEVEARKARLDGLLRIRALLTPEQRAALTELRAEVRQRRFAPVMAACAADIEALCPAAEPGRATARCLRERRDELSEECHGALRERGPRGRGGHGRGGR